MKVFTVYAPPEGGRSPSDEAERMVFVKDGFSWPALFVAPLWLIWHRLWLVLVGWLAIVFALTAVFGRLTWAEPYATPAAIVFALWFAVEANALRRWTLERRGWRFAGIATGRSRIECEQRFFARWLETVALPRTGARRPAAPQAAPRRSGEEPVIGLFPKPE